MNQIIYGDNLEKLQLIADNSFQLIYIDPPFNTGRSQTRTRIKTTKDEQGDRVGFKGEKYSTNVLYTSGYDDKFDNYLEFLKPRIIEAHRVLSNNGSLFFHIDYREVHYCKIMIDEIFGRDSFMNEIIWAYDFGGRSRKKWSAKHDNILWYAKNPGNYIYNYDSIDRIPYLAPGLVGKEKAELGKTPTDVWWHTIVPTNGKEKTGYSTQKPLGIINRIVKVHSNPGDNLLDFFAGSGTFGEAAAINKRQFTLIDSNPEAIKVMEQRLSKYLQKKL